MQWPEGKRFAFTIIDDTDNSNVGNIASVYDILKKYRLSTTKTVWVYPPRDNFSGQCLQDEEYLKFIQELISDGFEIALHGVGSGSFSREEITAGLEEYKDQLGSYPTMHVNHSRNPDNIYWGSKRFTFPLSALMSILPRRSGFYKGECMESAHFWGDLCKEYITYQRNLVFNGINTLNYDPQMPIRTRLKDKYSNYWFSSSDGHTVSEFNALIIKKNIDQLEKEGGCCIIYTHFAEGFVNNNGDVDANFEDNMQYLSEKNGWFVPAGKILDHLRSMHPTDSFASYPYLLNLDLKWVIERVVKKIKFGR